MQTNGSGECLRTFQWWTGSSKDFDKKLFEDIRAVTVYRGHVIKLDSVVSESLKLKGKIKDVADEHKNARAELSGLEAMDYLFLLHKTHIKTTDITLPLTCNFFKSITVPCRLCRFL